MSFYFDEGDFCYSFYILFILKYVYHHNYNSTPWSVNNINNEKMLLSVPSISGKIVIKKKTCYSSITIFKFYTAKWVVNCICIKKKKVSFFLLETMSYVLQ